MGRGHLGRDLPSSLAGQPPLQTSPEGEGDRVGTPWCPACFGTLLLTLLGRPRSVEKAIVRREPCAIATGVERSTPFGCVRDLRAPSPSVNATEIVFSPGSGFSALTAPRQ